MKPQAQKHLRIHTLGPEGTNCQLAVYHWLNMKNIDVADATIILHPTLEEGLDAVLEERDSLLLACIVYPKLNELVFNHLDNMQLADCFIMPTYNMVLATKKQLSKQQIQSVVSHPAPVSLVDDLNCEAQLTTSNSHAAMLCANEKFDACITTRKSAELYNLIEVEDFGQVPMGFSIHSMKQSKKIQLQDDVFEVEALPQVVNG